MFTLTSNLFLLAAYILEFQLRVGLVNEKNSGGGNYSLDEEGMIIFMELQIPLFRLLRLTPIDLVETSGISLNSTSRAELMQKLAARQSESSAQAPVYKPAPAP
jgi:hypothetical protein